MGKKKDKIARREKIAKFLLQRARRARRARRSHRARRTKVKKHGCISCGTGQNINKRKRKRKRKKKI